MYKAIYADFVAPLLGNRSPPPKWPVLCRVGR